MVITNIDKLYQWERPLVFNAMKKAQEYIGLKYSINKFDCNLQFTRARRSFF